MEITINTKKIEEFFDKQLKSVSDFFKYPGLNLKKEYFHNNKIYNVSDSKLILYTKSTDVKTNEKVDKLFFESKNKNLFVVEFRDLNFLLIDDVDLNVLKEYYIDFRFKNDKGIILKDNTKDYFQLEEA